MTDPAIDEAYEIDADLTAHMLHQQRTKDADAREGGAREQ